MPINIFCRYKTIDYLRRNRVRFKSISIEDVFDEIEANQLPEFDSELDLESLCEKLSTKQRDLLLLVKVEGLSITEAAEKTGYSISDVKVTVHRAIKDIKKQLKENGHDN
jgi:RNA polymerase sigma-70 factor (ECF subfamily)